MPRTLSVTERNDVATVTVNDSLNLAGTFLGAGQSSSGVGSWFQGTYGALWLNADGTFSYRLDLEDPDTNVLAVGLIVDDRFTVPIVSAALPTPIRSRSESPASTRTSCATPAMSTATSRSAAGIPVAAYRKCL